RPSLATWLILIYIAWRATKPQYSERFAFLAEMHFERFLAIVLVVVVGASGVYQNLFNLLTGLTFLLFAVMIVSSFQTEYPLTYEGDSWLEDYSKRMVFYLGVLLGLRSIADIKFALKGTVYVVLFYQLYSWLDFVRGGSYVYQQGMKRMVGV